MLIIDWKSIVSIEKVKNYLKKFEKDKDVLEFEASSATVELAAAALNTEPARIAKTLSFKAENSAILVVAAGDVKIDNKKFKSFFGFKPRMLSFDDVEKLTGHAVGGVCPFALPEDVKVYTDVSLRRFDTVFPACGSSNSAIELTCDDLFRISQSEGWVDVCKSA